MKIEEEEDQTNNNVEGKNVLRVINKQLLSLKLIFISLWLWGIPGLGCVGCDGNFVGNTLELRTSTRCTYMLVSTSILTQSEINTLLLKSTTCKN